MRFAFADPPYPGNAGHYPERQEVDHARLIARLVRVCSWHRPARAATLRTLRPRAGRRPG
jgi:hypothetical protein